MTTTPSARGGYKAVSAVLFLCLFAGQAGAIALSPVLADVARDLDVSTAAAGQLRTIAGLVAGITALALAHLGARVALGRQLLGGSLLLALGSLASAAAPSMGLLAAAQVPVGAGIATLTTAGTLAAAEWVPRERRAASWALIGQPAAWIVGMPLVGALGSEAGAGRGSPSRSPPRCSPAQPFPAAAARRGRRRHRHALALHSRLPVWPAGWPQSCWRTSAGASGSSEGQPARATQELAQAHRRPSDPRPGRYLRSESSGASRVAVRKGNRRNAFGRAWRFAVPVTTLCTEMDQLRLGASGLHVSRLALGMMSFGDTSRRRWVLDEPAAEPIVRRAIEGGISFFDTADMYAGGASEIVSGRLLRRLISRDEAVVATKVFYPMTPGPNGGGLSRKHILAAIDASLERLGMDYVDLYQIHRWDPNTPIEETMQALHDVVRAGKARYVGASTMAAWQFAKAQATAERHGWTRFVSMQNHYNLLYREEEREMLPLCVDQGVGVLPYSPLARGLLASTRTRQGERRTARTESDPIQDELYGRDEDFEVIERAEDVARERGLPPAQIALAWLLHKPVVTAPIIGATRISHIDDAIAATNVELARDEIERLEEAYRPHARS